jgi:uncharacterized protein YqeY
MSIFATVNEQLKESMKAKDADRTRGLRGIRAAFIIEMKADNSETLSDERCVKALRSLAKQRKDSIEAYTAAARPDLAQAEQQELDVIEGLLPKLADEATTTAWVQDAIAAAGATTPKELGKVLGLIMKAHKDEIDGTLAKAIATKLLGG